MRQNKNNWSIKKNKYSTFIEKNNQVFNTPAIEKYKNPDPLNNDQGYKKFYNC